MLIIICTAIFLATHAANIEIQNSININAALALVISTATLHFIAQQTKIRTNLVTAKFFLHLLVGFILITASLYLATVISRSPHPTAEILFKMGIICFSLSITSALLIVYTERLSHGRGKHIWITYALAIPVALITLAIMHQNLSHQQHLTFAIGLVLSITAIQLFLWRIDTSLLTVVIVNIIIAMALDAPQLSDNWPLILLLFLPPIASTITQTIWIDRSKVVKLEADFLEQLLTLGKIKIYTYDPKSRNLIQNNLTGKLNSHRVNITDAFKNSPSSDIIDFYKFLKSSSTNDSTSAINLRLSLSDDDNKNQNLYYLVKTRNSTEQSKILIKNIEAESQISKRIIDLEAMLARAITKEEHLLALASHELRTPISVIEMLAEELQSGEPWSDIEESFVQTLDRLTRILDDLRLATGTDSTATFSQAFTIDEIIATLLGNFSNTAKAQGCKLEIQKSENTSVLLIADRFRLQAALSRVIHNALLHAPNSRIVVSSFLSQSDKDRYILTWQISDTGPGVEPLRVDTLFEPFQGTSNIDSNGTTGLGLYTARSAMRIMGGDLRYERDEDITRFILTHPVRILDDHSPSNSHTICTESSTSMAKFPDKVALLVEDNQLVGQITVSRLSKVFGDVHWATTGDEGLAMYKQYTPDIIIMDQLLPGMNGDQATAEIRKINKDVPIIGVTASAIGSECERLEAAGANYAFEKPLKISQIDLIAAEFFKTA